MKTYTDDYAQQQELLHQQRPDYGTSGRNYSDQILQMARKLQTKSVLDYGCGKATLSKTLPFPIQNYDPFIREYTARPTPADIVVCTDVMEHIEENYVDAVLADIRDLTLKMVFFQIATGPAQKTLPDGRNAHITQRPASWWLPGLCHYFEPAQFQNLGGGLVFLGGLKE